MNPGFAIVEPVARKTSVTLALKSTATVFMVAWIIWQATVVIFRFATSKNSRKENSLDFVLEKLYGDGAFPPLVDLAVCGIKDNRTVVWVIPSGFPLTRDLDRTWNQPKGAGPFKAIGLGLPAFISERGGPFRLADLADGYAVIEEDSNGS